MSNPQKGVKKSVHFVLSHLVIVSNWATLTSRLNWESGYSIGISYANASQWVRVSDVISKVEGKERKGGRGTGEGGKEILL